MKKLLILVFVVLPLLAVLALAVVVVASIEDRPVATGIGTPDALSLARGRDLIERYRRSLLQPEALTTLAASEQDLNQMLSLAGRGLRHVALEVRVRPTGMTAAATLRLPQTPLGQYVNAWVAVVPSNAGLVVESARLGAIDVPGWLVLRAVGTSLDAVLGVGRGDEALSSVRRVAFSLQRVEVTYRPTPELIAELERSARRTYREIAVDIDPVDVRAYYATLLSKRRRLDDGRKASFAEYLGAVMDLAKQRAETADAARENRAAIIALAIFFGDSRFERLVGDVRTGELAGPVPDTGRVVLQGRHDLVQHFTISAALTVSAGTGIADVIGELKEVQDTGAGGSGFSFTDIAADRAGARFGETATASGSARRVQNLLAGDPLERMFFPSVAGLPEFMPAAEFTRRFGSVGSAEYERVVRDIDGRLAALAVFGDG
jgi:hypothetical protein